MNLVSVVLNWVCFVTTSVKKESESDSRVSTSELSFSCLIESSWRCVKRLKYYAMNLESRE